MAVTRAQIAEPPVMQPRGPGSIRTQITSPPNMRPRGCLINPTYRMRGIVSGSPVYWDSLTIDTAADYYTGATTPTSIVVTLVRVIGSP